MEIVAVIALVVGLLLGFLVGRVIGRVSSGQCPKCRKSISVRVSLRKVRSDGYGTRSEEGYCEHCRGRFHRKIDVTPTEDHVGPWS